MHLRILLLLSLLPLFQAHADEPFKGLFTQETLALRMELNLYEANIPVPGLEEELCYGYMKGRLNGVWVILRVKELSENEALVRAVNDKGSDAQDVLLTLTPEGDLQLKQQDGALIKAVEGKKYVKLPKSLVLRRMK